MDNYWDDAAEHEALWNNFIELDPEARWKIIEQTNEMRRERQRLGQVVVRRYPLKMPCLRDSNSEALLHASREQRHGAGFSRTREKHTVEFVSDILGHCYWIVIRHKGVPTDAGQ
jgi:hypothetical protein